MREKAIQRRVMAFWLIWLAALSLFATAAVADVSRFAGSYSGSADIPNAEGALVPRDMSVEIFETSDGGFAVEWQAVTTQREGGSSTATYQIEFRPTERPGIYAAAMGRDVFGNAVQLDPMKGEPFVWARLMGDTLTVYSMTVEDSGGYDLQQFDRTLTEGGLDLRFQIVRNGEVSRSVETFLERQ